MGREYWQVVEVNEADVQVKVIAGQIEDKQIADMICQLPFVMSAAGVITNVYMIEELEDYNNSKSKETVHPFKYLCYLREAKDNFKIIYGILPSVTRTVREKPVPHQYLIQTYEHE